MVGIVYSLGPQGEIDPIAVVNVFLVQHGMHGTTETMDQGVRETLMTMELSLLLHMDIEHAFVHPEPVAASVHHRVEAEHETPRDLSVETLPPPTCRSIASAASTNRASSSSSMTP